MKFTEIIQGKQEFTVGFLGGSITEGACASVQKNRYASRLVAMLNEAYPETKFTDLKWMSYRISIIPAETDEGIVDLINDSFGADTIEVLRKNSDKTVDIRPLIKSATATASDGSIVIDAILSADPSAFLNPEYVIKYLKDKCGILSSENLMDERYEIIRLNAYFGDMTEFR